MKMTRDVANDLLPVYLAGEASDDTRALLEEYLREHPDFARELSERADRTTAWLQQSVAAPPPDLEKATLERVRRFNRYRSQVLALAVAWTILPLSFVWHGDEVKWFMLLDSPAAAGGFWAAALICWAAYWVMGRRLQRGL